MSTPNSIRNVSWAVGRAGTERFGRAAQGLAVPSQQRHDRTFGDERLQTLARHCEVPVINGIIVTNTKAQAEARCVGEMDRGSEFAQAALVMAAHRKILGERLDQLDIDGDKFGGTNPFAPN